jgi:DeoR family transcriptional regulator of aga operon
MEQRRNQIVELVNRKGSISFAQLKEAFPSVSEMTLRTDLKALDEARRVVRVHGGVKSVRRVISETEGKASLSWEKLMLPLRFTSSTI